MNMRTGLVASCLAVLVMTMLAQGDAISDISSLRQGQRSRFDSKDSTKASGLRLTLDYPSAWKAEDDPRKPNVVKMFRGVDDEGCNTLVMLLINDAPTVTSRELVSTEFHKAWAARIGGTFIKSGATKVGGEDAGWFIYTQQEEKSGISARMKCIMFVVSHKGKCIGLQCAVAGLHDDPTLDRRFDAYLPIFQFIANSILFPDAR